MRNSTTPPPLPEAPAASVPTALYAAAVGAVLAAVVARAMIDGRIWHPGCGFRSVTGLPCPACGGTHALAALGSGDVPAALASPPLVALVAFTLVALAVVARGATLLHRGSAFGRLLSRRPRGRRLMACAGVAVVANWVYLLAGDLP